MCSHLCLVRVCTIRARFSCKFSNSFPHFNMHLLEGHNSLPSCNKLKVGSEDEKGKLEAWALVYFCSLLKWLQASIKYLQLTSGMLLGYVLSQLVL